MLIPPKLLLTLILDRMIPMVQEMILLTLALYKAHEYLKELAGLKGFHLVQVCIKDQALYYVL